MAVVVSDAGPLIALAKTDSLFVLKRLFSQVVVPDAVRHECVAKEGLDSRRIEDAVADGWLSVAAVQVTERFPRSLGRGEIEAIQLALDAESALLTMDDRLARREAMRRGLDYMGTVGVSIWPSNDQSLTMPAACCGGWQPRVIASLPNS